jgi:hypothetical protein
LEAGALEATPEEAGAFCPVVEGGLGALMMKSMRASIGSWSGRKVPAVRRRMLTHGE